MRWTELTLAAGLVLGLAGIVLTVRQVSRRNWGARQSDRPRTAWYVEGIGDLAIQALLVGALALMQFSNVAGHIAERTLPANLWLSFVSSAMILILFGVLLGRLLMRWQLRRLLAEIDAESARSSGTP